MDANKTYEIWNHYKKQFEEWVETSTSLVENMKEMIRDQAKIIDKQNEDIERLK